MDFHIRRLLFQKFSYLNALFCGSKTIRRLCLFLFNTRCCSRRIPQYMGFTNILLNYKRNLDKFSYIFFKDIKLTSNHFINTNSYKICTQECPFNQHQYKYNITFLLWRVFLESETKCV